MNLIQAEKIVDGAIAAARAKEAGAMAVVVLDAGGHIVCVKREDGASLYRYDIAFAKAKGALGMGFDTRGIAARAQNNPVFFGSLNAISGIELALSPGGNLVRNDNGEIIGAVGLSGDTGDVDEECAIAGIEAAQLFHGAKK